MALLPLPSNDQLLKVLRLAGLASWSHGFEQPNSNWRMPMYHSNSTPFLNRTGPEATALSFAFNLEHAGNKYAGTTTAVTFDLPERYLSSFLSNAAYVCAEKTAEETLDETGFQLAARIAGRHSARRDPRCVIGSSAYLQCTAVLLRGKIVIPFSIAFESNLISPTELPGWLEDKYGHIVLKLFDTYERVNSGLGREKCVRCGEFIDPLDEALLELLETIGYCVSNYGRPL
jgi:hypothetical protein